MKALVGLVIAILIIFTVNLFWPTQQVEISSTITKESVEKETIESVATKIEDDGISVELNAPSNDEKVKLMTETYAKLEISRKDLKRRLSRVKHEMWGLKFEPEQAKKMSNIMLDAHKLIRNPDMLGAFLNVKTIEDEIAKIAFAEKSIDQVSVLIEDNKLTKKKLLN